MADRSISEILADYDIRHEETEGRRRHIYWQGRSFGLMDSQEACTLLELLGEKKLRHPEKPANAGLLFFHMHP